ncbi:signal peptidase I [Robertmurraya massiliosenegalensis]|uniref:signal peptidase I n=1 Tax=Robertmurraya massiliosenegalensis TaxID=1287657 RepID=UPI0002DC1CE0|nr:signal peptidase I [Robertmurraya massiliosenegalensis]
MIKRTFKIIANLFSLLLVIVLLLSLYSFIQSTRNSDSLPSIFGFNMLTILTGSMEPGFTQGDFIIIRPYSTDEPMIDDVVTYRKESGTFVTHRIVDVVNRNGTSLFQTKGDANNVVDEALVHPDQIVGSVMVKIPKLGFLLKFVKSPLGLITITSILFLSLIVSIIKKMVTAKKQEQVIR